MQFSGFGKGILDRLREQIRASRDVTAILSEIDAPWARSCALRLQYAIGQAEIKRPDQLDEVKRQDRQAKILLSLPGNEDAFRDWLRDLRLVEGNSDWLSEAITYGMDRLRVLSSTAHDLATELSGIDDARAQSCAKQLEKPIRTREKASPSQVSE